MRIWSVHPRYLDTAGLTAVWRETLLAQAVLAGRTRGYRNHPQLERFRDRPGALQAYLTGVWDEATARGYRFNRELIDPAPDFSAEIPVTRGQVAYELEHLRAKLATRAPELIGNLPEEGANADTHPIFRVIEGGVEPWEKT